MAYQPVPRPDAALLALRPTIDGQPVSPPVAATIADFQHQVLRPLLKLQHELLVAIVADFAHDYHVPLATATRTEAAQLQTELLARNTRLRATLIGVVTGLLTAEEFAFYRQHSAELNRRLLALVAVRVGE